MHDRGHRSAQDTKDAPPIRRRHPWRLGVAPDDGIAPILDQVKSARRSVDLVMYELSDAAFEAALVADHHRGVRVRVLLNGGYHGAGGFPQNDAAYAYLTRHGVAVRWTPPYFALTHEKAIVVDGNVADIMTLNLTPHYYGSSRDFAIADRIARDVSAITAAFDADWSARPTSPSAGGGDLVWSPGALSPELALIGTAHRTVDVYNEEMADPRITDALAAAAGRGVDVKVVMTASPDWDAAFARLAAAGVHVRTYAESAPIYIHAKMILVDSHAALVGSQNFSAGSLEDNRELGILVTSPAVIAALGSTFRSDDGGATPFTAGDSAGTPTSTSRRPRAPRERRSRSPPAR